MSAAEDADTIDAAILDAIAGPAKVSGDAGSVEQHKLADLIAAAKYARSKAAVSGSVGRGIRLTKLIPPGTV